jgi:hypothetical protein
MLFLYAIYQKDWFSLCLQLPLIGSCNVQAMGKFILTKVVVPELG